MTAPVAGTAGAEGGESIPQMAPEGLLWTRPHRTGKGWVRGGGRGIPQGDKD